jgi:futalosine hydrolase
MPLGCSLSGLGWYRDQPEDGHDVLVTGVGMTATAYHLGRILERESYRLAINIGMAGTFYPDRFPVGSVVEVVRDVFSDLGAEDNGEFVDVFRLGLTGKDESPFANGLVAASVPVNPTPDWALVEGATVNTVHGNEESIRRFMERSTAEVESMEGAAFLFCCAMAGVPARQFRAISNVVEPRNRAAWRIPEALSALEAFLSNNRQEFP